MQPIIDHLGEQTSNKSKKITHEIGLDMRRLEENTQFANLAGNYIGILMEAIHQDLLESNTPLVVWNYCAECRQGYTISQQDINLICLTWILLPE